MKEVMMIDVINMIMMRERVMKIEVITMIMIRDRLLLVKMKGITIAIILRNLLMTTMTMMMTTPKWVEVIYLSHKSPVMKIVKHNLLHAH
jgi:hypothetical protein